MESRIVLASGSPRRRELLGQLGVPFTVHVSEVDEDLGEPLDPEPTVLRLAERKARVVAGMFPDAIVLAADTEVFLDGERFGKPVTPADARTMLARLSGREHRVLTAVAVIAAGGSNLEQRLVESKVTFHRLTAAEIDTYVRTGEPMDRAGSYAIQGIGRALVERVDGCFANVIGLPLCATSSLLVRLGIEKSWPEPACSLEDGTPCPNLTT